MSEHHSLAPVTLDEAGQRLDRWLSRCLPEISRTRLKALIEAGAVTLADGMVLNEHHQNIYGLMPSPNIIAAALAHATKKGKIVVLSAKASST